MARADVSVRSFLARLISRIDVLVIDDFLNRNVATFGDLRGPLPGCAPRS